MVFSLKSGFKKIVLAHELILVLNWVTQKWCLDQFFLYTQMNMDNLYPTSPNMSSIREVCDRLGKTFLTSLVGNHWATGGLLVNSTFIS